MVVVSLTVAAWGALGIPARATPGARTTADEPQYLLTAISLAEDRSLDIADELAAERWRTFHADELPVQTEATADGRALSPHDPLLPVLLAVPVAAGGATGAKAFLSVLGGVLAGLLVWTAVRRLGCRAVPAGVVVAAFGLSPPLAAYATQVYPELPAALAGAVAIAALAGPLRRFGITVSVVAIVALPWLGVKYAPVAAALAATLAWRLARTSSDPQRRTPSAAADGAETGSDAPAPVDGERLAPLRAADRSSTPSAVRSKHGSEGPAPDGEGSGPPLARSRWAVRRAAGPAVALAVAAVGYLVLHRLWYGGWTVYAAGDHFIGGELDVVGTEVSYPGRAQRLVGLVLDRDFGLAAWGPVVLVAVGALAALARRRPLGWGVLVLPLAAGWLNATFVALTMHGYWWPGRQVVVVVPCLVLATAWWVDRLGARAVVVVAALGLAGMGLWASVLWRAAFADWTLIVDVDRWANPVVGAWRRTLPDGRDDDLTSTVLQAAWLVAGAAGATWAWRRAPGPGRPLDEG